MAAWADRWRPARDGLVSSLRARGIADERVLAALAAVDRRRFVPRAHRGDAYLDRPLPLGHGATISQPYVVARMLELAELAPGHRVLDVGTGSGWSAALAAELVAEVVTVERVPELATRAAATLAQGGHAAVTVVTGDGHRGWPDRAPYDAVLVAAAADHVPPALVAQLTPGGRLVLPVGRPHEVQQLVRVRRVGAEVHREDVAAVRFVPLVGGRAD